MAANLVVMRETTFFNDQAESGTYDPGDVLTTRVTIKNDGDADATNVTFQDDFSGTTMVAGSLNISPIAFNDSYTAVANTVLRVGGAGTINGGESTIVSGNLLSNDVGNVAGDNVTGFQIDATSGVTGKGGKFNIFADGSFNYVNDGTDSDADLAAGDSFEYKIRDKGLDGLYNTSDDLVSTATVTIRFATQSEGGPVARVWFVDGTNGSDATGDGTSANPFSTMAALNGAGGSGDVDAAGHVIYLESSVSGGIALEANQQLIGTGSALNVGGFAIAAAGAHSTLTHNGAIVTLASGNAVSGLNLVGSGTSAIGIVDGGASVGTLTVSNVGFSGSGRIIDIDQGGTINVTLNSASTTGSAGFADGSGAIDLNTVNGSFTVTGATSITGGANAHTGGGIDITNNVALTVNLQGNVTVSTGGNIAINFSGNAAASKLNMTGAVKDIDTTTGTALNFTNNGSNGTGTVSITGGGLDVDTTSGTGLNLTSTILNVSGANNTINTSSGVIFTASGASVGAQGVTFAALGSSSSAVSGTRVNINDLDGGTFTANSVTIAGTTTSGDGIFIGGTSSTNFNFGTVTIDNTAGDGIEVNGFDIGNIAITTVDIDGTGGTESIWPAASGRAAASRSPAARSAPPTIPHSTASTSQAATATS